MINIYKISAIIGTIFLFLSLNPFVLWLAWPPLINTPVYILVFVMFLTLLAKNKLVVTGQRLLLSSLVILFACHITLPILTDVTDFGRFLSFFTFSLILLMPKEILGKIFYYFRDINIYISVLAIIIFCLTLFMEVPHIVIRNSTLILSGTDFYYKLYGFVVSSTNTVYTFGGVTISRLCGAYPEPGHFASYLSLIILIEKVILNKMSKILIVAGVLTFSPVFYITLLLIFFYEILYKKNLEKIRIYLFLLCGIILASFFISDFLKDQIWELAIGRNMGESIEGRLDERTNSIVVNAYERFIESSEIWIGKGVGYVDELGLFSDFRGFIFKYGIIGLGLSLLICLVTFKNKSLDYIILMIPFALLIYIHRSWMFGSMYLYMLFFISSILYNENLKVKKHENI